MMSLGCGDVSTVGVGLISLLRLIGFTSPETSDDSMHNPATPFTVHTACEHLYTPYSALSYAASIPSQGHCPHPLSSIDLETIEPVAMALVRISQTLK